MEEVIIIDGHSFQQRSWMGLYNKKNCQKDEIVIRTRLFTHEEGDWKKKENRNLKPSSPMSTVLIDSFEKLLPYRTLLTFWIPDDHRIGKEREKERMLLRRRCCCTAQLRDLIQTKGTRKIGDRLVWSIFPFLFFPFFLFSGPRAVEFSWVRSVSSHIVYTYIYINIDLKKEKRRIERESENEGKFSRPSSMDWVPECRPSLARAPRTTFSLSKKIFPKKSLPDKFSVLRPFFFLLSFWQ